MHCIVHNNFLYLLRRVDHHVFKAQPRNHYWRLHWGHSMALYEVFGLG